MSSILKRNLVILIVVASITVQLRSENVLNVTREISDRIAINLQNSEPVSAIQFSVNVRGTVRFAELVIGNRAASNGWQMYPHQKDDSTWNVVLLSPFKKPFDNGNGDLVTITMVKDSRKSADSNIVFLTRTEVVNPDAQILQLTVAGLAWSATEVSAPALFSLGQNFPNPFNPSTTLSYKLDQPANVRLVIYDVAGREIKRLVGQYQFPGQYSVTWASTDESGKSVPSGMYVARLQVENETAIRKMVLTK